MRRKVGKPRLRVCQLAWIALAVLFCAVPALAQSQQDPTSAALTSAADQAKGQSQVQPATGSISGTVVDQTGTAVSAAHVTLTRGENPASQEATSDEAGQFFFVNVLPGAFQLTVSARGFVTQTISATVRAGEAYAVPSIALAVAGVTTQVKVMPTAVIAEAQIKQQEQQRVLGVPNFYVSYVRDAAPLNMNQKFQLAWHSTIDPVNLAIVAGTAGIQQAFNQYSDYGQGAEGYGKRFGAAYGDVTISTFLGGAILPSLFKQDPRFFFKEDGSKKQRVLYAIAASIMCKSDRGRWEPNYSGILGSLAAGGISNLYTPDQNRSDLAVTFEGTAIGIGAAAGENILQEFVVPKFTKKKGPKPNASPGVDGSSTTQN
ncbi:MAG TPA: carboxypeptidase-like regulatory domain-containing protein [Candidatus Acidoferrum sp.]|nr:carboxypeptidase-like regulatory domain-containing protein [Candidatus Acidoferrum sp.]